MLSILSSLSLSGYAFFSILTLAKTQSGWATHTKGFTWYYIKHNNSQKKRYRCSRTSWWDHPLVRDHPPVTDTASKEQTSFWSQRPPPHPMRGPPLVPDHLPEKENRPGKDCPKDRDHNPMKDHPTWDTPSYLYCWRLLSDDNLRELFWSKDVEQQEFSQHLVVFDMYWLKKKNSFLSIMMGGKVKWWQCLIHAIVTALYRISPLG